MHGTALTDRTPSGGQRVCFTFEREGDLKPGPESDDFDESGGSVIRSSGPFAHSSRLSPEGRGGSLGGPWGSDANETRVPGL